MILLLAARALAATATCDAHETPGTWVGDACLASTDVAEFCGFAFGGACPAWDRGVFTTVPWHGGPCEGGGHSVEGTYFPEEPTTLWFDAEGRLVGAQVQCDPSECAPGCCDGHWAYDTRWGETFDCVPVSGDTGSRDTDPVPTPGDAAEDPPPAADAGCGCDHATPGGPARWLGLALALLRSRRGSTT